MISLFKIGGEQTQGHQENKCYRQSKLEINGGDNRIHNI
jgi:hypothetical protein